MSVWRIAAAAALMLSLGSAWADVFIESVDADGKTGSVTIAEDRARIDTPDADVHVLLVFDTQQVLAVNVKEGFAMDMKSPRPQRSEHGELASSGMHVPEVRLRAVGTGPAIAGFDTMRYQVLLDGMHCYDEFLATKPLDDARVKRFTDLMSAASGDREELLLALATDPKRVCDAAADLADDRYPELGIPMRTVDTNGKVTREITGIRFDADHVPAALELPSGFPILSRKEVEQRMGRAEDPAELERRQRDIERKMRQFEPGLQRHQQRPPLVE